jgi:hypothetical protein
VAGHVFHPGHEALHGVTVVLDTSAGRTIVGRYHDTEGGRMRLHEVAVHDPAASELPREEWLRRTLTFGVRAEHKFLAVPADEVTKITPLGELSL